MHSIPHLASLTDFLMYLGASLGLTALYMVLYTAITPHSEWKLLREGNLSAALALGASLLGFVLPLASAIAHSVSLLDCVFWGSVSLVVQILAFFGLRLMVPTLCDDITADRRGTATIAAFFFVSVGILNAACLSW